jgi:hypothetical protein
MFIWVRPPPSIIARADWANMAADPITSVLFSPFFASGVRQAAGIIADRIEGKVGTRRDEEDLEDQGRRGDMQAVIESVVIGLVNAKLNSADDSSEDSASDRAAVVIDAEVRLKLGDD